MSQHKMEALQMSWRRKRLQSQSLLRKPKPPVQWTPCKQTRKQQHLQTSTTQSSQLYPSMSDSLTKAMTSLAGGPKKKADEPNKKVVLKRDDINVIVDPIYHSPG